MSNIAIIQSKAKRLPARIINSLGMSDLPVEVKKEFAEGIWEIVDKKLYDLIWKGAANEKILNAIYTEYEIDTDIGEMDIFSAAIENQPDILEKIDQELDSIYKQFIQK